MDNDGVSPIFGVMLMILLTVVVAVFVIKTGTSLTGSLGKTSMPIFTLERVNSTHVKITLYSAGGAKNIENCRVKYENVEVCSGWNFEVGLVKICRVGNGPGNLHLICNVDGEERIVLKSHM